MTLFPLSPGLIPAPDPVRSKRVSLLRFLRSNSNSYSGNRILARSSDTSWQGCTDSCLVPAAVFGCQSALGANHNKTTALPPKFIMAGD